MDLAASPIRFIWSAASRGEKVERSVLMSFFNSWYAFSRSAKPLTSVIPGSASFVSVRRTNLLIWIMTSRWEKGTWFSSTLCTSLTGRLTVFLIPRSPVQSLSTAPDRFSRLNILEKTAILSSEIFTSFSASAEMDLQPSSIC